MAKEDVLKNVEDIIRIIKISIKKKKCATSDQVRQLTGLVNSYTRLLYKSESENPEIDPSIDGDPTYYDENVIGKQS